jgi:hypothetical protein
MCAKKISSVEPLEAVQIKNRQASLDLSTDTVSVHKNGIEFRSPRAFTEWSEMTVSLQSPSDGSQVSCHGVVVACTGNKHSGYHVSLVFTSLTPQAEQRLQVMARSSLGLG